MRWKLATAGAVAAAAIAAIGASAVLAGDTGGEPGQDPDGIEVRTSPAMRVAGPSSGAPVGRIGERSNKATTRPRKPKLIYLETRPLPVGAGRTGQVVEVCPGNAKSINGYYFVKGVGAGFGLVNEGSSPAGLRRWSFYLENTTGAPIADVTFGLICIKGVL